MSDLSRTLMAALGNGGVAEATVNLGIVNDPRPTDAGANPSSVGAFGIVATLLLAGGIFYAKYKLRERELRTGKPSLVNTLLFGVP